MRRITTAVASVAALAALGGMAGAAPTLAAECSTCTPWWHLTSATRPTVVQEGTGSDDVQRLTVEATGGEFLLVNFAPFGVRFFPWNASAATVQAGLSEIYPANRVEVSGGPEGGVLKPYTITFPGQAVPPVFAIAESPVVVGVEQLAEGHPDGQVVLLASNLGDASVDAGQEPVSIADTLPPGLTPVSIEGIAGRNRSLNRGAVTCQLSSLSCTYGEGTLPPFLPIEVVVGVNVTGTVTGKNKASVSGGGAPTVATRRPVHVGEAPGPFGVEDYGLSLEEPGGSPDTQAGSHPFQATFALTLNQKLAHSTGQPREPGEGPEALAPQPVAQAKDLVIKLPPGLVGNPTVFPRCRTPELTTNLSTCPQGTAVGVAMISLIFPHGPLPFEKAPVPLFNMEPSAGEPARFGFKINSTTVFIDTAVRTGGDYGVTTTVSNINQEVAFLSSQVTVWGVPGDPSHDISRGSGCIEAYEAGNTAHPCQPSEQAHPAPLLSLPTSCTGELQSSIEADSWNAPGRWVPEPPLASDPMPAMDGCNRLPFTPSISVTPDGQAASTPTGLTVDVHVPQEASLNPTGLAESAPRNITVALPEGVQVNPSGGDGLLACSEGLVGFQGFEELPSIPGTQTAIFTPRLPGSLASKEAGETAALEPGLNFCPNASKIATATIRTPILPHPIEGAVYLAAQNQNPFESLIAMYIVAEDPVSGVLIKLAGQVHLSGTGQLVATFGNSPQAPFEDAELHFFGGERAPLATPAHCRENNAEYPGEYVTNAVFTPWSGNEAVNSSSGFKITSGPHGTPCPPAALPFSPSLTGGTTNITAGAFTQLTTTIGRPDGQQDMQSVQLHMPPGVSGLLSGVKLCPEAQANEGTCGPESLIGETTVSAGVGSDPVSVVGGKVYITEHYAGSPFGLSIVNPVKTGPFDLEHDTSNPAQQPACDCVVVRARIAVDPTTAALTITTDPSGPHAIPHLIDGIPVQIQKVNVLINRPGFTFNPTNCNPAQITGAIVSAEGADSPVAVPFQVANCANLKFTPKFTVSTSGRTSKRNGANLSVKLSYPGGSFGAQANIARVKVELPKQLPSRLTTLQKACLAATFETNPASCPPQSIVGRAKVITPLLPVPLEGPAYFVSHGGAAFPSLTIVLTGYGVTVRLVGDTFINKKGVTSSTFKATPDVPFDTFELTLPQGPFSALAANTNLCRLKAKLHVPTEFRAQNGQVIHAATPLQITHCVKRTPRHRKHTRPRR
jgi:hypothetical protein